MPEMIVRVVGDTRGLQRATRESRASLRGLSVDVNDLARTQVEASARTNARLRAQASAYRELAHDARLGATEQAEALRLAERAERGFVTETHHATTAHREFRHELEGGLRGTLTASGAFAGLGRSLAFASGGFVAAAGIGELLRSSIAEARDAQKAQASLAAQLHASGESFKDNKGRVEETTLAYAKFGFDNEQVLRSLVVLERGSGNITRAIRLQGLAADIARAKNIDLAAAAGIVAKVFGGQESALRRAVPGLAKNAHGLELIRLAQDRLKGQALANTSAADRFNATLHDSEEIIGTALLPVLNHYLESLSEWLDRMNRSGRLQRDVNGAVRTGQQVISGLKAVVEPAAHAFEDLGGAVGGTKNEVELLASAFAAFKIAGILKGLGLVGATAKTSTGEVNALRLAILRLPALTVLTVAIEVIIHRKQIEKAISDAVKAVTTAGAQSPLGLPFSLDPGDTRPGINGQVPRVHFNVPGGPDIPTFDRNGNPIQRIGGIPQARGVGFGGPLPLTPAQQLQLDLAAHPDDIATLRRQADHDRAAIAFLKRLRATGKLGREKFVSEVTAYTDDLTSTLDHINGINADAARKAEAAAKKAAEAAKKAREAAAKRAAIAKAEDTAGGRVGNRATDIFKLLPGVGRKPGSGLERSFTEPADLQLKLLEAEAFGHTGRITALLRRERAIALRALRSSLGTNKSREDALNEIISINSQLQKGFEVPKSIQLAEARASATGNQAALTKALKQERAAINKSLKSQKLGIDARIDAYNELANVNSQLGQQIGAVTEKAKVSARKFATSIAGLSRAQRIAVESRFAQVTAHGGARPTHLTVQGQATTIVNVNGAGDPNTVATKVAEKVGRANRARGATTRGPYAGRGHLDAG